MSLILYQTTIRAHQTNPICATFIFSTVTLHNYHSYLIFASILHLFIHQLCFSIYRDKYATNWHRVRHILFYIIPIISYILHFYAKINFNILMLLNYIAICIDTSNIHDIQCSFLYLVVCGIAYKSFTIRMILIFIIRCKICQESFCIPFYLGVSICLLFYDYAMRYLLILNYSELFIFYTIFITLFSLLYSCMWFSLDEKKTLENRCATHALEKQLEFIKTFYFINSFNNAIAQVNIYYLISAELYLLANKKIINECVKIERSPTNDEIILIKINSEVTYFFNTKNIKEKFRKHEIDDNFIKFISSHVENGINIFDILPEKFYILMYILMQAITSPLSYKLLEGHDNQLCLLSVYIINNAREKVMKNAI